jgi:hypothetical protein
MPKKNKSKKRKQKIRIGKDLARDTIGTNQLLNENEIDNIIQSDNIIYNKNIYKQYKQNINEQKTRQKYGGDPTINIKLKHESHNLYNHMINNIFNGNDENIQTKIKTKNNKYKSEFEKNIDNQTKANIKKFSTRKELDSFLVKQSEKMLFPPEQKINEWRNQFTNLLNEDEEYNNKFNDIVLDYFDEQQRKKTLDIKKKKAYNQIYKEKEQSYTQQRKKNIVIKEIKDNKIKLNKQKKNKQTVFSMDTNNEPQ